MASDVRESSFIKHLASSDRRVRDRAVETLREYLRSRSQFDELELMKLWKGLFYCMWMSDRPRTQQQLARDLASLVDECRPKAVMPFLDAFWKTMAREWIGIDVLRMDKFLYLVRQYLYASFQHLSRRNWSISGAIDECMSVLQSTPLNPDDPKIPDGLRYHVIDIYVDGLEQVSNEEDDTMPLDSLLRPLEQIGKESRNKKVRERVREALEDERLRSWRGEEVRRDDTDMGAVDGGADSDQDEEWGGLDD